MAPLLIHDNEESLLSTLLNKYGPYQENTQPHGSNPESSSHNVEVPEVCPQIGPAGAECPQRPTGISEVCPPEGPADFKIINLNSCTKSKMKKVPGFLFLNLR